MSIFIKGTDMPPTCICPFVMDSVFCSRMKEAEYVGEYQRKGERHPDCPLSNVPFPHGRLIDADRLLTIIKSAAGNQASVPLQAILDSIEHAATVIEAESGEEK